MKNIFCLNVFSERATDGNESQQKISIKLAYKSTKMKIFNEKWATCK